jgi:hypothetical protein
MIRLLFTILVCAVASSQATAQNNVSQTLLGLSDEQRNETFTYLLQDSDAKCDRVIRTLFHGSTSELDVWEAQFVLAQYPAGTKRRYRIGELP